ncbi:hypothetical protein A33M_1260 [Rhodovulum sp. PH10]|uniref:hypothetical protein n=1 Tax=Rhodovulum sp. PH10 TaxID=1187851 RepID=UPI00027C2108|nr:hypothetical protein [Rhodovulum sp. PH10]EJW09480.1 hypothetical protein A33M_1260 [Rhodovulum sp. PH10]
MPSHIVRVAAQNLAFSVIDTNDLSTIRGGGLALLAAVEAVDAHLKASQPSYRRISLGASELLAALDVAAGDEPSVEADIRTVLAGPIGSAGAAGPRGSDFSFAVAVEPIARGADKSLVGAVARAEARLRVGQYRTLSFVLPDPEPGSPGRPCEIDRVRPAAVAEAGVEVSRFVAVRRRFGRAARQGFYDRELERDPAGEPVRAALAERALAFTNTLSDLTADTAGGFALPPALSGKIAVVHLDGNGFQRLRNKLMRDVDAVAAFSTSVRTWQTRLLARLLAWALEPDRSHMIRQPVRSRQDDDEVARLRFETLLWGGDEMVFAVPVWAAWSLVLEIEDELHGWELPGDALFRHLSPQERRLTHGIGLAFVNHKAPIRQSRSLADDLCSDAKRADKSRTIVSAFAAESVELPRGDLDRTRERLLLDGAKATVPFAFAKPAVQRPFQSATTWFRCLKGALDRSQAMKLALEARQWPGGLAAADAGSGDAAWSTWAAAELTRVLRERSGTMLSPTWASATRRSTFRSRRRGRVRPATRCCR